VRGFRITPGVTSLLLNLVMANSTEGKGTAGCNTVRKSGLDIDKQFSP